MELISDIKIVTAAAYTSLPPTSSSSPSPTFSSPQLSRITPVPSVVMSPCAACKILRRRCDDKCVLAPYFPPSEPLKFTTAHRVFGASNITKLLQELPESLRADAVSSMVYEATARIRDPVYGCAGAIFRLQKQVGELQAQLARAQAELVNLQAQKANLIAAFCVEMAAAGSRRYAPDFLVPGAGLAHQDDGLSFPDDGRELGLPPTWSTYL